jgi:hypothetical protein
MNLSITTFSSSPLLSGVFLNALKSHNVIPVLAFKTLLKVVFPEYLFPIIEYTIG